MWNAFMVILRPFWGLTSFVLIYCNCIAKKAISMSFKRSPFLFFRTEKLLQMLTFLGELLLGEQYLANTSSNYCLWQGNAFLMF